MERRRTVFEYREDRGVYVCGECGLEVPPERVPEKDWNYCPGCGLPIRGFYDPRRLWERIPEVAWRR